MSNIYVIYKITNIINNKQYIGFTNNFIKRIKEHLHNYKNKKIKGNSKLYRAIRKYGENSFKWEIIYQHWDHEYCLNIMEPLFIDIFNTIKNGYNFTKGGGSIEFRSFSEAHRKKCAINCKRRIQNGELNSPEMVKRIMEKAHICTWRITYPTGKIEIIKNLHAFCKANNLSTGNMSSLAKGNLKYYKGWGCVKLKSPRDH